MPSKSSSVEYCGETIPFTVFFSKRKTISIFVHPDCVVKIKAPQRTALKTIKSIVFKKAKWIIAKQEYFQKHPTLSEKKYISGEKFIYLGQEYDLKIEKCIINKAKICEENLTVFVTKIESERVKKLVDEFYAEQAGIIFNERFEVCVKIVEKFGISHGGKFKIRKMKRRWGSCRSDGNITLNSKLIKASEECIDYVIIHELCHLKEMNHSKRFYELLEKVLPDWKMLKEKLNRFLQHS